MPTRSHSLSLLLVAQALLVVRPVGAEAPVGSWPQWRGSFQNGVAIDGEYPTSWGEQQNIDWKSILPGRGGSTPVVNEGTSYLTSGVDGKNVLLAINNTDGSVKWKVELGEDRGGKHRKGSGSNPSAVVSKNAVYAYFRSGDLACVDLDGKILWKKNLQADFGEDTLWWDLGTSPLLTDTSVVIAVMQSGPSYVVAFARETGEVLWKTDRMLGAPEEAAQSYATPLAVQVRGQRAIAVMGADHLTLHRSSDGKEIGRLGGFNPDSERFFRSISSPVAQGSIVVCPYARGATLTAVDMNALASGKRRDAIVWFRDDLGSDVPTPAVRDGKVYCVSDGKANRGLLSCLDIKTGESAWTLQLPKSRVGFSSSPLIAGDYVFVTQEDATTYVIGPLSADQPSIISKNELLDNEPFTVASPVPDGDGLLIRSRQNLYRVATQAP